MSFSLDDAKTIATILSAVVIPFAVMWLKTLTWPDTWKFALAAFLSLLTGGLTAYVAGQVIFSGSLIQNAAVIFSATQIVYYGAFRGLGLEKVLFPQQALINQAQSQVADQVVDKGLSNERAKDILDPNTPPTLDVSTKISNEQ